MADYFQGPTTISTVALALTAGATDGATTGALVTVEGQPIRYRTDGTAPTASAGHLAPVGVPVMISGHARVAALKMIATVAGDATIHATVFRP